MYFEFDKYQDSQKGDKLLVNLDAIARITRESKSTFAGPTSTWTRLYLAGGGKEDFIEIANTYESVRALLESQGQLVKAQEEVAT
jgi:hypothetical protein